MRLLRKYVFVTEWRFVALFLVSIFDSTFLAVMLFLLLLSSTTYRIWIDIVLLRTQCHLGPQMRHTLMMMTCTIFWRRCMAYLVMAAWSTFTSLINSSMLLRMLLHSNLITIARRFRRMTRRSCAGRHCFQTWSETFGLLICNTARNLQTTVPTTVLVMDHRL